MAWSKYKNYIYIFLFTLLSSFIVWLPFVQQLSFLGIHIPTTDTGTIYKNYDGLLYVIAAKSWYLPSLIDKLPIDVPVSSRYFAAHLPLYPGFIALFALAMSHVKAMMVATVFPTVLLGWFFYYFVSRLKLTERPLLLTFVFLMLPRFLVVRSVGSPESLFMLFTLVSLFFFHKKSYVFAGLAGGLATMTKLPGILLFPAMVVAYYFQNRKEKLWNAKTLGLLLIPGGLLAVCLLYLRQYGDFFAYWHTEYVVPMPYPYAAFTPTARWIGTHWLEELVLYFALYAFTIMHAFKHKVSILFYFTLFFFLGLIFVQHRDIARYALPMWPATCIVFERFLTSKKTLWGMLLILPAIYLYAWGFMSGNIMPVSNWAPFL